MRKTTMFVQDWARAAKQVYDRTDPVKAKQLGRGLLLVGQGGLVGQGIVDLCFDGHLGNKFAFASGLINLAALYIWRRNRNYPVSAALATTSVLVQQLPNLAAGNPWAIGACATMAVGSSTGMSEHRLQPKMERVLDSFKSAKQGMMSWSKSMAVRAFAYPRVTCALTNFVTSAILVYDAMKHNGLDPPISFGTSLAVMGIGNIASAFSRPGDRPKGQTATSAPPAPC
jgi:hypothetical protein